VWARTHETGASPGMGTREETSGRNSSSKGSTWLALCITEQVRAWAPITDGRG